MSLKKFVVVFLLINTVFATSYAQQKVYKVHNNPDGTPFNFKFSAPASRQDDRNIKELTLWGNLILTDHQGPSLRDNVFYTYTTAETDQRLSALDNKITSGLTYYIDSLVNGLNLSFNKLVVDNVDGIKQQLKLELIEEIKTIVSEKVKEEMDKMKADMQTQIDDLKRRLNNR